MQPLNQHVVLSGHAFNGRGLPLTAPPPNALFSADGSPPLLELPGPVSSPLPGDAPLEPPVLGVAPGGRRSPGRSYKRQRSARSGGKGPGEDEAEVGETACPQPEAVHEVTPLGRAGPAPPPVPATPLAGVGRRTSILFKKAKNGARLPGKSKASPAEDRVNGLDGADAPSPAMPTFTPLPSFPSPHHLRSRGPSSDGEPEKPLPTHTQQEGRSTLPALCAHSKQGSMFPDGCLFCGH